MTTHATNQQALTTIEPSLLDLLLEEHRSETEPKLRRLWDYYRNPTRRHASGRRGRLAQEDGLPTRLTNSNSNSQADKEIVIENDIAWRMNTIVNFMFGKPLAIQSTAKNPERAGIIQRFLHDVFKANGGDRFFQDLGLLGSVYGYVDILLRVSDQPELLGSKHVQHSAQRFVLETVEAPRAIPLLSQHDYRRLDAYALHFRQRTSQVEQSHFLSRVRNRVLGGAGRRQRTVIEHTQVWTPDRFHSYTSKPGSLGGGRTLVEESVNPLGRIPVVHIQNLSQPFFYEGLP